MNIRYEKINDKNRLRIIPSDLSSGGNSESDQDSDVGSEIDPEIGGKF